MSSRAKQRKMAARFSWYSTAALAKQAKPSLSWADLRGYGEPRRPARLSELCRTCHRDARRRGMWPGDGDRCYLCIIRGRS